ncbi:carbonic anhydrase [Schizopora paradoxa]|uniref:Carbonic anhydrase n=1 Tax=Schizopora paradoxa TaxID=27342 RepID=A0A0H2RM88_9AGAM|nr:carbonic anhydrase [Schizopora paradoxa]
MITPAELMPDLARFLSSNAQWADDVGSAHPQFFAESAKGQSPKVLWIGCADSRVPESVIVGCKPGDIFVHRNIANQFHLTDDSAHAVLAYAVGVLGVEHVTAKIFLSFCDPPKGELYGGLAVAVNASRYFGAFVVVGHTNCGGVLGAFEAAKAASTNTEETPLTRWLGPLVNLSKEHMHDLPEDKSTALRFLVEENVKAQVENIAANAVIKNAWEKYVKEGDSGQQKKVFVHGWVYGLEDGRLRDLGVSYGPPSSEC